MKIEGVILAAGFSSRAGAFKMALDFNGKTVIENVVSNMKKYCSKIYVVGGFKIEIIEDILKTYSDVEVVFNENYTEGMFSSVKKGIECLKGERFFFTPGDYPYIKTETYKALLNTEGDIIIPVCEGRKGHPVLIDTLIGKELLKSDKFHNLKEYIDSIGFTPVEVNDKGILKDLDTMEDYKELLDLSRDTN